MGSLQRRREGRAGACVDVRWRAVLGVRGVQGRCVVVDPRGVRGSAVLGVQKSAYAGAEVGRDVGYDENLSNLSLFVFKGSLGA